MRRRISLFIVFQFLFLSLISSLPALAGELICPVCRQEIHHSVKFVLTLGKGRRVKTCCPGCGIYHQNQKKIKVKAAFATDFINGKSIKADEAIFIEHNDLNFCNYKAAAFAKPNNPLRDNWDRCSPSLIAFGNPKDALEFQSRHGGRLYSYKEILKARHK